MKKKNNNKLITTVIIAVCALFSVLYLYAVPLHHTSHLHPDAASKLGWVSDPYANNICYGYFVAPVLNASGAPIVPLKQSATTITADSSTFSRTAPSVLKGHVVLLQPGRRATADRAVIYHDPKTGKYKIIDLFGNIHAYEQGKLVVGDYGHFDLINKTSTLKNVFYRVSLAPNIEVLPFPHLAHHHMIHPGHHRVAGGSGWGHATSATQTRPGHTIFSHVTYSTCAPDRVQWHIMATKLKLNKETGEGVARNATLYLRGVPIFYTPYFKFPISNKRKTGFLYPTLGYRNQSGAEVGIPFYWNMAPNYDDTITPTFYSKRGVLFKNIFRYLHPNSSGMIGIQVIANDREFSHFKKESQIEYGKTPGLKPALMRLKDAKNSRYLLLWKHDAHLSQHWQGGVDYARASDDYFLQDFGNIPEVISTNLLLQKGWLHYQNKHWLFTGLVQNYQTLHPVNRPAIQNTYAMLPQLKLTGYFPNVHGLDVLWKSDLTYFTRTLITPGTQSINGGRFHIKPGISLPLNWIWGFLVPSVQLDVTQYNLQNQIIGRPNHITRTLPILSLHGGLYFDRLFHAHGHGHGYLQTLEPEIFYLYVPYRDQRAIPVFDSGLIPFRYQQLFATNRFSGEDRIGDANQLSLALTTRIMDNETGEEKFRFSIGQIYYFQQRRVMVCSQSNVNRRIGSVPYSSCDDFTRGYGAAPNTTRTSPIAMLTSYHFTHNASVYGELAWDKNIRQPIAGSFYYAYSPALNHILNVGYSFIRHGSFFKSTPPTPLASSKNNLSQIFVNGSWPLSNHWSVVGVASYNISQQHSQTVLAGLEYNSCCLRIRFVGGRTFSHFDENGRVYFHNAFYFQVGFKGLGNVGANSISTLLASSISGYVDPFIGHRYY